MKKPTGWIGVVVEDVSDRLADSIGIDETHGAVVCAIVPDAPADCAGLEIGDLIVEIDGRRLADSKELREEIGVSVDREIEVKIFRGRNPSVISMTVRAA